MENTIKQMREDWILSHTLSDEEYNDLSGYHPDERMISCPDELILSNEREVRYGRGYVLGDGAWYDPVDETFFAIETVENW